MATKSKSWTARRPVKICCWILIPIAAFMMLLSAVGIARVNFDDIDILFTDIYNNNYFYDANIPNVLIAARIFFAYKNEDNIRDMGCLEWRENEYLAWSIRGEQTVVKTYTLITTPIPGASWTEWGVIETGDPESPAAKRLVKEAIDAQIAEYNYIQKWLGEVNGLYYFISDGDRELTNLATERGADFFRRHPVYWIQEFNGDIERSRRNITQTNRESFDSGNRGERLTSYIAFSQDAVNAQNDAWVSTQQTLNINIALLAGSFLVFLLSLIILIAGAGRRYGDADMHFTAFDKLWLDFSLAVLFAYEAFICYGFYILADIAWSYGSIQRVLALCALLAVLSTLPFTAWIICFSKHCKTGKWWRHTAFYAVPRGIFNVIRRFFKSLWAGFSLTVRAALLGVALFICLVLCALNEPALSISICLLLPILAVFGLLRYARKLHLVEQGAKAAGGGQYGEPIAVAGGELGSIAVSINSISDGINAAVAERMKSERLKTELITNISHDIRTPLTSLITYTDLLKNEGLDNEKAPEYLEILVQKSARLKTLTDDLFEASKAASGNVEAHIETLDLTDFMRQVLGELDARVRESGLDFRQNLPERAPVGADGKLLWRVVENLLSNVFKYTLPGSRVYIDVAQEDGAYRLDIKNISAHPLNIEPSELIERFKRGDSARSGDGSGLGLSIAQSFTQAQGGQFILAIDGDLFKATVRLPARAT